MCTSKTNNTNETIVLFRLSIIQNNNKKEAMSKAKASEYEHIMVSFYSEIHKINLNQGKELRYKFCSGAKQMYSLSFLFLSTKLSCTFQS